MFESEIPAVKRGPGRPPKTVVDIAPPSVGARTLRAARVQFRDPVLEQGRFAGGQLQWALPANAPFDVTPSPWGLERNGVMVPWSNVICVVLAP